MNSSCTALAFGAQETLQFVQAAIQTPATILEVGCGQGKLALELIKAGYTVTAIDNSIRAVDEARKLGVPAQQQDFLEYRPERLFDALVFSRVLHHLHPLEMATAKINQLLAPNGLLLIDDFGVELIDAESAVWFFGLKSVINANGPGSAHGPKLDNGRIPADPLESWFEHHTGRHDVIESRTMHQALSSSFTIEASESVPYLYRYFLEDVSWQQAEHIQEWEIAMSANAGKPPIGIRWKCKKKS